MKYLGFIILLSALFLHCGCTENELNPNYPEELINTWVHSYEENTEYFRANNPATFPASRYRQVYTFMEDNICEYLVSSPVDAHYIEIGTWEYDYINKNIRIYKKDGKLEELKVISISPDLLRIKR